jgi:hypothetical protein
MATDPPARAPAAAPPRARWRAVLPFVLALGLVGFVLSRLDLRAFWGHLGRVSAPAFVGFSVLFVLGLLSADTLATVLIYRRSVAPIRFRDFWVLRGASYLPSTINHHLGQAMVTLALSRVHGVSLARVAGATLLVYASWMGCVLGLFCVAIIVDDKPLVWLAAPLGAGLAYLGILALRPARLARTRLLAPLFEAGVQGHLFALVARLPHLGVLFLGTWLPFWFFGVHIPFPVAAMYVPVVMVAVTLPITPQGFGTRDVLAATFFERFAPGEGQPERLAALAASTTAWGVSITLVEIVLGLYLLRRLGPTLALAEEGSANREGVRDSVGAARSKPPTEVAP